MVWRCLKTTVVTFCFGFWPIFRFHLLNVCHSLGESARNNTNARKPQEPDNQQTRRHSQVLRERKVQWQGSHKGQRRCPREPWTTPMARQPWGPPPSARYPRSAKPPVRNQNDPRPLATWSRSRSGPQQMRPPLAQVAKPPHNVNLSLSFLQRVWEERWLKKRKHQAEHLEG